MRKYDHVHWICTDIKSRNTASLFSDLYAVLEYYLGTFSSNPKIIDQFSCNRHFENIVFFLLVSRGEQEGGGGGDVVGW